MIALIQGHPEHPFFEQNPELQYYTPVADLIKTEGEERAGRLMWAVYLTEDPNSRYYRIPYQERRQEIARNYLHEEDFDWELVASVVDKYPQMSLSKEQVLYKMWADKIDEGLTYVRKLTYDSDSTKIVNILDKISKMWKTYEDVQKKMVESQQKANVRGGATLSTRERRRKRSKAS